MMLLHVLIASSGVLVNSVSQSGILLRIINFTRVKYLSIYFQYYTTLSSKF